MGAHTCPECGRGFETQRGLRVHHTQIHGESLPNRECAHCSVKFHCEYEKKYCSEECLAEGVSFAGVNNPNYSGGKEQTTCELCNASFEYYPSEKRGLYCPTCVETEQWQTPPKTEGKDNSLWSGGREQRPCEMCGKLIERWPSEFTDVACCGEECRSKWLSETFTGPNHPNWKGKEKLAYGPGWDSIRRQAVERDGHRCLFCETTRSELGQNPDVHHIVPVRWFVDSDDHERRDAHTLDNVISLCRACHRRAEGGNISDGTLRSLIGTERAM